jgi:hypothetical protein
MASRPEFHVGAALVAALRKGTHKRCPYIAGHVRVFRKAMRIVPGRL